MKKHALLTGAAGCIGRDILATLKSEGWMIVNSDLPGLSMAIDDKKDDETWVNVDLTQLAADDALEKFYQEVKECVKGAPINALINCAAIQVVATFQDITAEQWIKTMTANVVAPALMARSFLSDLRQTKGSIVTIGGIHSNLTKPKFTCYATSKAALGGLTRALAVAFCMVQCIGLANYPSRRIVAVAGDAVVGSNRLHSSTAGVVYPAADPA